jgi:hypothetical protein
MLTGLAKSVFPVTPSDRYSRMGLGQIGTTETSAAQLIMGGEFHLLSEVARGGVEPPTCDSPASSRSAMSATLVVRASAGVATAQR